MQDNVLSNIENTNTWELFFEQPLGCTLDKADSENLNIVNCDTVELCSVQLSKCKDYEIIEYWRKLAKKYIRFNQDMLKYLEQEQKTVLKKDRVIGVLIREGYDALQKSGSKVIKGHPKQPPIMDVIEYIKLKLSEWNCDKVYVVCQTIETIKLFQQEIGTDKVVYSNSNRGTADTVSDINPNKNRNEREKIKFAQDYIRDIYLLSKCNSIIGSSTSGFEAAFIMSDGFENFKCLEAGYY